VGVGETDAVVLCISPIPEVVFVSHSEEDCVDRTEKVKKIWKPKERTESETEEKNRALRLSESLETHKALWAETSFTRHGVGLSQTETKPIQTLKPPTVTLKSEVKKREKDKACGPAFLETHKAPWAETSFTRHRVGLSQTETKPIQTLKPPTVTLKSEVKKREKDKACGPALQFYIVIRLWRGFVILADSAKENSQDERNDAEDEPPAKLSSAVVKVYEAMTLPEPAPRHFPKKKDPKMVNRSRRMLASFLPF
ncbi:LOW QUALITY PROTEIN: hypothetical protein HID58_043060, partial [Brassica napus]